MTDFPGRATAPGRDPCDVCVHPEQLHDERIRTAGKPPCSTCSVCAAVPEYACPRCHTPGMVLPFSAHTALNGEGVSITTWEHGEWSHHDDAECGTCGFSGHVGDFTAAGVAGPGPDCELPEIPMVAVPVGAGDENDEQGTSCHCGHPECGAC